jgi:hypothetical protein
VPVDGFSSFSTNRRQLDFPEPEAPTRKTNSPRFTSKSTALRAGFVVPAYFLVTWSKRIMAVRA